MIKESNINFMKLHKASFALSALLVLLSIFLICTKGLNFGIDFSGGILIEARMSDKVEMSEVRKVLEGKVKEVQIQDVDNSIDDKSDILIRIASDDKEQSEVVKIIQDSLSQNFPDISYRKIDYVGPQIGAELIKNGLLALVISFFFILVYIWIRFDWQFGIGGIIALIHDAIITVGFYSITQIEFNTTSIAALLTVIGYSINDSVVIYDRIRENLRKYKKMELFDIINSSTNSTLSRTLITSGVTLFSLVALILFGGDALFSFSIATFFGIVIGTYSSLYIAAPILLYFDPRKKETKDSL